MRQIKNGNPSKTQPTINMNTDDYQTIPDGSLALQTLDQFRVVRHLCDIIKELHQPSMMTDRRGITVLQFERSGDLMEYLGETINAMDAVDGEKDEWMNPIFDKLQEIREANKEDPDAATPFFPQLSPASGDASGNPAVAKCVPAMDSTTLPGCMNPMAAAGSAGEEVVS
jgi:hypothetical protein